jgi:hypothetical protein
MSSRTRSRPARRAAVAVAYFGVMLGDGQRMQLRQLEMVNRHIVQSDRHVDEQQCRIFELDRGGHDTSDARAFLESIRVVQLAHTNHRDRILRDLSQS